LVHETFRDYQKACREFWAIAERSAYKRSRDHKAALQAVFALQKLLLLCQRLRLEHRAYSGALDGETRNSFSVSGGGIRSTCRLTCAAMSGCVPRVSVSVTAIHARRTTARVRNRFASPDSTRSMPCFNSRATNSMRSRI